MAGHAKNAAKNAANSFVHLHTHSHYSLLDGALRIEDMVSRAKSFGQPAIALTDHGNMFGAVEFYLAAIKAGVKPIVGCEFYVAPGDRRDREAKGISDASYHLLALATNRTGYQNLLRLASLAYREGFYYRPRIDKQVLAELHEGLICCSACLGGEVASRFLMKDPAGAREAAESYLKIFGADRYFLELQDHGQQEQKQVNPEIADLAKKLGVGLVATNDAHYLELGDAAAHDVLCCIQTGKLLSDPDRLRFPSDQVYLKSGSQMEDLFAEWPEAIANTTAIAGRCNLELDFKQRHAPVYHPPAEMKLTAEQYLRKLAAEGLTHRFGEGVTPEHRARLDRELSVVEGKGFASYFLIVWDLCRWARGRGIPAAPRGSGCGTLLGYVLGIGNVNPLQYGLLFERFMDPSRNEMPDIDIDICQIGRGELIDYVRKTYGHVAQIITFNTLAAKAAIRDVGRVLNVPLPEVDKISKLVPTGPKVTLDSAMKSEPDFKAAYETNGDARRIIDIAKRLEGLARNSSVHAAGVVIADRPLENFLPLCGQGDEVMTQFEGPIVDKVGMLKMDFLGLRTLTVIEAARKLIKARHKIDIDPEALPLDDAKVYELFARGQTDGVFQFESGGMKDLLMKLGPDRLEDLIACNALYRPGPMQMIGDFCERKHSGKWPKVHPIIDRLLDETYGIMVYQEQVMQIANQLGGIELSRAYKLIKAISKKQEDIIEAEKENFYKGAQERGISKQQAEELFELILKFAGYGFNKSHSTRYAIVAYQTAWLKMHYPLEYMAALLTYEMVDQKKTVQYIEECRRMGIAVLPPDINSCDADFTVDNGSVRFGLAAVKGVGAKAVESIISARAEHGKFTSLYQFAETVDLRLVNKSVIEALIKCGAFDSLGARRSQLAAIIEKAMAVGGEAQSDRRSGQANFFDAFEAQAASQPRDISLPDIAEWPENKMLEAEKEVLGFYVTSHPLSQYADAIENFATHYICELSATPDKSEVTVGGMLTRVRPTVTKNGKNPGQKMAIISLEDLTGTCDGVIFPNDLAKAKDLVEQDKMVFLRGRCDRGRETPSIVVSDVVAIDQAAEKLASAMVVSLNSAGTSQETLAALAKAIESHRGPVPIYFSLATVRPGGGQPVVVTMRPDPRFNARPAASLLHQIEQLLGPGRVRIVGPKRRPQKPVPATEVSPAGIAPAGQPDASEAAPATADRLKEFAPAGDHIDDALDADE